MRNGVVASMLIDRVISQLRLWLTVVLAIMALPAVAATTHTWTGLGSSANWNDASNWSDGLPSNGDNLIFDGTTRQTNTNNLLTSIGSIVISTNGYKIAGNPLTINGNFGSTGDNSWSIPLTLTSAGKYFESLDGTLTLSGNITNAGNTVTFKANYGVGVSGPITVSGVISGTGGVIKDGSGTVTFTRDNTYSGKTTLTAGHLAVSKDSNLGTVPGTAALNIELNGGFLEATSSFTLNSKRLVKITATGGNTGFWSDSGVSLTYAGVISAMNTSTSYGLRLDGPGTIVLSGTNTYYGGTTIYAGVVRISNAKAFGSSASTMVEVNNLSTLELTNNITVNKPLSLDYARLVNVSGNNTWLGEVQILVNTSGKSVVSAASGTQLTVSGNVFINTDTETMPLNQLENLYVEGAGNVTITGIINGDGTDGAGSYLLGHGDVVMDGTGTLTLEGVNTYSGRTIVNSGIVAVSADSNLGAVPDAATAGRIVINGGTLEAYADFTLAENRGIALGPTTGSGSGTVQIDAGYTVDYGGIIADNDGSSDFYKTGDGTFVLAGDSIYSGVTTIDGGTLQIGNGGTTGSINVNSEIVDNATLAFNQSDTVTQGTEFNSLISGTGGVSQNGSDTLILNGANTYEGPTAVNSGVLLVVNTTGSATGTGEVTVYDTATLAGNGTIGGAVTVKSGGRVEPGATPSSVDTLNIGGATTFEAGSTYEVDIGVVTNLCDKLYLMGTGTMTMSPGAIMDIVGTVNGDGRTLAYGIARDGITGEFDDTAANLLEDKSVLHLAPNTAYTIRYMDMTTTDDGYIVLKLDPTAAGATTRAYATPNGVVVEFATIEEAGPNDIILYLLRNGQWVEVGRQPAAGEGSHTYRFLVPGLSAGDVVDLIVRDDEGKTHSSFGLTVGNFTAQSAQISQMDATGMTLQWDSVVGSLYDVYYAETLNGSWEYVRTIKGSQSQTTAFIAIDPSQPAGFFRIGVR